MRLTSTLVAAVLLLSVPTVVAQTWETAADHAGDDRYFLPDYPVAFVAARVVEVPGSSGFVGQYHIATDVLSANNPDRDNHL